MSDNPDKLQALLNSSNFGEQMKGINQLRSLEPKEAFRLIQPLITHENARIRYAAVSMLDSIGTQDLNSTLNILRDRLYNDTEFDVQAAAADVIGGLKLTEAYDDLKQMYFRTKEWLIQVSIVAALGEFGDMRGVEILEAALNSDNSLVKTAAVSALGELNAPDSLRLLLPLIEDEDWQIRYRLAQALGNLGGEAAKQALTQLSQDSLEQVAREAQSNLQRLG
jgi:HEAT repeat protein